MRKLSEALGVGVSAVYHYFDSESEVIRAVVRLVFGEAIAEFTVAWTDASCTDRSPEAFLTQAAVVFRRVFLRHWRVAPYLSLEPEETEGVANLFGFVGTVFEELGVSGEQAGNAVAAYGNYVYGSVVLRAMRLSAKASAGSASQMDFRARGLESPEVPTPSIETARAIEMATSLYLADDETGERYFIAGLTMLIEGIKAVAA